MTAKPKARRTTKERGWHMSWYYNLSLERYRTMLETQNRKCACCKVAFTEELVPYVDHDHSCCHDRLDKKRSCGQCIRGLVCRICNNILGAAQDSSYRLRCAVKYLRRA